MCVCFFFLLLCRVHHNPAWLRMKKALKNEHLAGRSGTPERNVFMNPVYKAKLKKLKGWKDFKLIKLQKLMFYVFIVLFVAFIISSLHSWT